MPMNHHPLTVPPAGFGLGLRTTHYPDFLAGKQPLDWLEIITDNYLVDGGKPLVTLDAIRRDYPMAMHGVALSLGAPQGHDRAYLRKVKALADRIDPLWISDHLCWIGPEPQQLHDLYPLPYTEEAARHLIAQIRQVQDVLQRRLVVENVSSYIDFAYSAATEWEFLSHVANEADCSLLVDINNIYVSSVNHGFDPLAYLRGLPAQRIQQFHLAGHSNEGTHIVDTHDHPVAEPVWALYAQASRMFGPITTMIERDDHIPPLPELLDELARARAIAADVASQGKDSVQNAPSVRWSEPSEKHDPGLQEMRLRMASYVLGPESGTQTIAPLVRQAAGVDTTMRLSIYHHAYRARLAEVLADSFEKTVLYMGSDSFTRHAREFAVQQPPLTRSLGQYGAALPAYLGTLYPHNPELRELAQLDWDLRSRFDCADAPALDAIAAAADTGQSWLVHAPVLHPSLVLREITSNVVQLWKSIDEDLEVPAPAYRKMPMALLVWRKDLQPHFKTVEGLQAVWLRRLLAGASLSQACGEFEGTPQMPEITVFGQWLAEWLEDGLLRPPPLLQAPAQSAAEETVS
jgi:uncharacterized protein (UPF0276 family)